jgi:hypothetical protein
MGQPFKQIGKRGGFSGEGLLLFQTVNIGWVNYSRLA